MGEGRGGDHQGEWFTGVGGEGESDLRWERRGRMQVKNTEVGREPGRTYAPGYALEGAISGGVSV